MKIVFLNDRIFEYAKGLSSSVGGAERQQWLLARALAANGWKVTVGIREKLDQGECLSINDINFVGTEKNQILLSWHRFLKSEQPDWWYWRCAYHLWGPAVEIARLAGVRTIFAAAFDTDVQARRALTFRPRWWPLYAWGLMRSDKIFLQHNGQLAALSKKLRGKAYIVPSIAGPATTVKPHSERRRYVAWVGMLREPKRPDLLVEIARQTPNIQFVVCGGPTSHRSSSGYGEMIVKKLRSLPNIEFLGQVSPEKAQEIIAEAAMLLSTSEGEGFPNTFLQAWSSGTPVISFLIDPDSVIERAGLGLVFGKIENIGKNISRLMESPRQRAEMASRARKHIDEHHNDMVVVKVFNHAVDNHFVIK